MMISKLEKAAPVIDRNVWIIDDDIPIQSADFEKDAMLEGKYPIDRGALLSLLLKEEVWEDKAVFELCRELLSTNGDIKAFLLPTSAVNHLRNGAKAPDVIIFDMNYRNIKDKNQVLDLLGTILKMCISVIQIYTKEGLIEVARDLEPLSQKFLNRLQPPQLKNDTHAVQLEAVISEKLSSSLSAQLAANIRKLSTIAIENVLVKIDDLPLDVAVSLLAGESENLEEIINDEELIELLSSKISAFLGSSRELSETLSNYAQKIKVPANKEKIFVDEAIQLFVTSVRTNIQYDKWLYEAVRSARQTARATNHDDDSILPIIQDFFAFRLYDQPDDDIVRTGDIISLSRVKNGILPNLFVVVTPPCDLNRFWKNTRGILTLGKMQPLTADTGISTLTAYTNSAPNSVSSVTSTQNPFIFPSIPVFTDKKADYALFLYEVQNIEYDGSALWSEGSGITKRARFSRPLTYSELKKFSGTVKRYCRISEPFLSGILSAWKDHLFRTGIPDFPKKERQRLLEILKSQ